MRFQFYIQLILALLCFPGTSFADDVPRMSANDKIRIREAISIADRLGEKIWNGISAIPFAIILVTDSSEFIMHHPQPPADFIFSEKDTVLGTDILYRKRQYNPSWLATFPVNGVSCIVAGTPANTKRNSTEWVLTLLHEHFHQYENSYPGYYKEVEGLGLSNGDQTGMWMLNYPFPYDSMPVIGQYKRYTRALSDLVENTDGRSFKRIFKNYRSERKRMKDILQPADYRYLSFQLWQEGIARYTEYKFLSMMDDYKASNQFLSLPDFVPFDKYREQLCRAELDNLTRLELNESRRICFYSIGFAEGILLDKLNPRWRKQFLKDKFFIEKYSKRM